MAANSVSSHDGWELYRRYLSIHGDRKTDGVATLAEFFGVSVGSLPMGVFSIDRTLRVPSILGDCGSYLQDGVQQGLAGMAMLDFDVDGNVGDSKFPSSDILPIGDGCSSSRGGGLTDSSDDVPEWRRKSSPIDVGTGDGSVPLSSSNIGGERRGKWYEKNKKTRDRRKKNRSNVDAGNCGSFKTDGLGTNGKSGFGYFSDCPLDLQNELKQTRAALLIMENKRRMVEEEAKIRFMESPGYLLKETIAAARTQAQVEKVLGGSKIGGWASTVASSSLEDVARRAPSNVPSLESIGFGKSALRSSDGSSEGTESSRRSEYLQKKEDLMLCYHLPNPDVEELRGKLYALDLLYEDVMYSPEEKIKRDAVEDVCRMLVGVVGTNKLSDIYTAMGMEDDARYA